MRTGYPVEKQVVKLLEYGVAELRPPIVDGLVTYYSFDGCSLEDSSGNGHDLRVLHGRFACIEGPWGGTAYFDGHTALASEPFPWPSSSFTIAYMIRVDKPYENVNGGLWVIAVTRGADSRDFTDPETSSFTLQFHA